MSDTTADFAHGVCLAYDMKAYSNADEPRQVGVQQDLNDLLDRAAVAADLDRSIWDRQPQGDGEVAVIPMNFQQVRSLLDHCLPELATLLLRHNLTHPDHEQIRLRVAVGHGLVKKSSLGFASNTVIETGRLLDSDPVRAVLDSDSTIDMIVALTDGVYRDFVRAGHTNIRKDFLRPVSIHVKKKNFQSKAWLWVLGRDIRRTGRRRISGPGISALTALVVTLLIAAIVWVWAGQTQSSARNTAGSSNSSGPANEVTLLADDRLDVLHMLSGTSLTDADLEVHPRSSLTDMFEISPWGTAKLAESLAATSVNRRSCEQTLARRSDDNIVFSQHGPSDGGNIGVGGWMCLRIDASTIAGIRLIHLDQRLPGSIQLSVSIWRN